MAVEALQQRFKLSAQHLPVIAVLIIGKGRAQYLTAFVLRQLIEKYAKAINRVSFAEY